MGTRADFYVGRGEQAEWLGSIAWDGDPGGIPKRLLKAATERKYRVVVGAFLVERDDATWPAMGWPWPWENSQTTDYAYAFDGGKVWASCFGYAWFDPLQHEPEVDEDAAKPTVFTTMNTANFARSGHRSGLIVLTSKGIL